MSDDDLNIAQRHRFGGAPVRPLTHWPKGWWRALLWVVAVLSIVLLGVVASGV